MKIESRVLALWCLMLPVLACDAFGSSAPSTDESGEESHQLSKRLSALRNQVEGSKAPASTDGTVRHQLSFLIGTYDSDSRERVLQASRTGSDVNEISKSDIEKVGLVPYRAVCWLGPQENAGVRPEFVYRKKDSLEKGGFPAEVFAKSNCVALISVELDDKRAIGRDFSYFSERPEVVAENENRHFSRYLELAGTKDKKLVLAQFCSTDNLTEFQSFLIVSSIIKMVEPSTDSLNRLAISKKLCDVAVDAGCPSYVRESALAGSLSLLIIDKEVDAERRIYVLHNSMTYLTRGYSRTTGSLVENEGVFLKGIADNIAVLALARNRHATASRRFEEMLAREIDNRDNPQSELSQIDKLRTDLLKVMRQRP